MLEVFLDIFNVTNRANFDNPMSINPIDVSRRLSWCCRTAWRGGFPRQAEMGFRFVF